MLMFVKFLLLLAVSGYGCSSEQHVGMPPELVEEISKVDIETLPILSKHRQPSESCEGLEDEVILHHYKTKNEAGDDVSVALTRVVPIIEGPSSSEVVYDRKPWIKSTVVVNPRLNCLEDSATELISAIREDYLVGENGKEYNFTNLEKNINGEIGQPIDVDKIVYGGKLKNGFFMEAGSNDAETNSDTLHFEIRHGWTGLLIEPQPLQFQIGLTKNRKATHIKTCLSTKTKPQIVDFDPIGSIRNTTHRLAMAGITLTPTEESMKMQCLPLYSILLAIHNPTIHYFSLDIEGAEFPVLRSIPWEKVDIKVISVETHLAGIQYPGTREDLIEYMASVGYKHVPWAHRRQNKIRRSMGTIDDLFVQQALPLAMTEKEFREQDGTIMEEFQIKLDNEEAEFSPPAIGAKSTEL